MGQTGLDFTETGKAYFDSADLVIAAREANAKGVPFVQDVSIEKHDYPPHFVQHHEAAF